MPGPYSDGFENVSGVSGNDPSVIPDGLVANAVNRLFRYGENKARLPITEVPWTYVGDTDGNLKKLVEGGNFQGATFYSAYPTFQTSCLVASFAGTVVQINIVGNSAIVTKLIDGNQPTLRHAWFAQGFEYLFIQDGIDNCIIWDGVNPAFRSDPVGLFQMPVGSVMAFNQGYMIVCSSDGQNQLAVSNQVYSTVSTSHVDLTLFTYTGPGKNPLGNSIFLGDVTGLFSMPYLDTGTGQNELLIACTEGLASMDLSANRDTWLDSQIIRVSLIGDGSVSSHCLCALNGDAFFRANNGINSFRNTRQEFQTTWNQAPISLDVRKWIAPDRRDLLEFNSQVTWNNFLFSTCSPQMAPPNNPLAGWHRYHRGFVVMDCEPESTSSREGSSIWYGMWEGIRPTQFVEGRIADQHRCFAFSYDQDGVNRLYEIQRDGVNDVFQGTNKKIVSFFDTRNLGVVPNIATNFTPKKMEGGQIELSEIMEEVALTVSILPETSACFVDLESWTAGCDCPATVPPAKCFQFSQPQWQRKWFGGFDGKCIPGTSLPLKSLRHWQGRVMMTGAAKVERMVFRFTTDPDEKRSISCEGGNCQPVDCCSEGISYQYQLAPVGTNPNVPFIPTPSDVVPQFNGTASYTAVCPAGSFGTPVTVVGSATSEISQDDANAKAFEQAFLQATAQIQCSSPCSPGEILLAEVPAMTNQNISSYFAVGASPNLATYQWRIIDTGTLEVVGSGPVNAAGTLIILFNRVIGGLYGFDGTNLVNQTGSLIEFSLEYACPTPQGPNWPFHSGPYY